MEKLHLLFGINEPNCFQKSKGTLKISQLLLEVKIDDLVQAYWYTIAMKLFRLF